MSNETKSDIVILAKPGRSVLCIYNRLARELPELRVHVIYEEPISKMKLVKGRYKRLGARTVAGQLAFQALAQPALERASSARQAEIAKEHALSFAPVPSDHVTQVPSVNDPACRAALQRLAPRVVVLGGTRIVSKETLEAAHATTINMHAGVTPGYRGVHGGYWALAEGRPDLVGTTIHVVDQGIDTGKVIEQVFFTPGPRDNFATYPLLHVAHGLPALVRAVRAAVGGPVPSSTGAAFPSKLHYHPTLWQYVSQAVLRGVR